MLKNIEYLDKKKEIIIRIALVFFGVWLILSSVEFHRYSYIIIGVVLTYVAFRRKHICFSQKGLEIHYKGIFRTSIDILPISQMIRVIIKSQEGKSIICFTEEHKIRKVIIKSEYVNKIISTIKKQNKDILIQKI